MAHRFRAGWLAVALVLVWQVVLPSPANAVIGGSVSTYGPWAVRMLVDGKPACTGTAITQRWIISASHCFFSRPDAPVKDARIEFRVGSLDLRTGRAVHPVPGSRVAGPGGADVMLIKVPRLNVRTAPLAKAPVRPGNRVRVLGWGATCTGEENGCQSNRLKQADLRVLPAKDKRCAGFGTADGVDFCSTRVSGVPAGGDSGGPVVTAAPRGKERLVGVFWGSDRSTMVGAAAISHQLRWIRSVTG